MNTYSGNNGKSVHVQTGMSVHVEPEYALRKEAIHTQINASLAALNLLKLEDWEEKQVESETVISIAS